MSNPMGLRFTLQAHIHVMRGQSGTRLENVWNFFQFDKSDNEVLFCIISV